MQRGFLRQARAWGAGRISMSGSSLDARDIDRLEETNLSEHFGPYAGLVPAVGAALASTGS